MALSIQQRRRDNMKYGLEYINNVLVAIHSFKDIVPSQYVEVAEEDIKIYQNQIEGA